MFLVGAESKIWEEGPWFYSLQGKGPHKLIKPELYQCRAAGFGGSVTDRSKFPIHSDGIGDI